MSHFPLGHRPYFGPCPLTAPPTTPKVPQTVGTSSSDSERPVRVHPALGAPYGQPKGQRIDLGRIGVGDSASVRYEPTHDEGSQP